MDERFTAKFWDERYGTGTRVWSGRPNQTLVDEVTGLEPGTALEAGCGEGADAHWLAAQGWKVTAIDVSAVALERGAERADPEFADRISWEQVDLTAWTPDDRRYDLVTAHYMHFPSALRDRIFTGLAESVGPGGTLLLVGHHPSDMQTSVHRPPDPAVFFTAEQIAAALDPAQWDVLVTDKRPRATTDPEGREVTIHDAVLRARRRGGNS